MNLPLSTLRSLTLMGALFAGLPRPVHAADPAEPSVVVQPSSTCPAGYADAALQHALEVELAGRQLEPWDRLEDVASPVRVTLSAECEEPGAVSLRVWSSVPRLVVARTVALRDVPEVARARTLALIVSEALAPARAGATFSESGSAPSAAREDLPPPTSLRRPMDSALFTRVNPYDIGVPHDDSSVDRPIRIGAGAQAHLFLDDDNLLLAVEVGASGPLWEALDWSLEVSHIGAKTSSAASTLDVDWWNASFGFDFVRAPSLSLSLGPRLSVGDLTIRDEINESEHTLVTQIGARTKLDLPLSDRASVQMTAALQHRLGVLALSSDYAAFDRALDGWLMSWGIGIAMAL
jgi:hypothetical protein